MFFRKSKFPSVHLYTFDAFLRESKHNPGQARVGFKSLLLLHTPHNDTPPPLIVSVYTYRFGGVHFQACLHPSSRIGAFLSLPMGKKINPLHTSPPIVKRFKGKNKSRLCGTRFRAATEPVIVKTHRESPANQEFYKKKTDTGRDTHRIKIGVRLWWR